MASTEESCFNDPNFAVICSFLVKFSEICDINITIDQLQTMLEDTQNVHDDLKELHIKLLRKCRKWFSKDKWEKALVKFCHEYSNVAAWELERFGYTKSKLGVKIEILKRLLELQFDFNAKFKQEVNLYSAETLRVLPIGRDVNGHYYWFQVDKNLNLRVYRETPGPELYSEPSAWKLVSKDKPELESLIQELEESVSKDEKAIKSSPETQGGEGDTPDSTAGDIKFSLCKPEEGAATLKIKIKTEPSTLFTPNKDIPEGNTGDSFEASKTIETVALDCIKKESSSFTEEMEEEELEDEKEEVDDDCEPSELLSKKDSQRISPEKDTLISDKLNDSSQPTYTLRPQEESLIPMNLSLSNKLHPIPPNESLHNAHSNSNDNLHLDSSIDRTLPSTKHEAKIASNHMDKNDCDKQALKTTSPLEQEPGDSIEPLNLLKVSSKEISSTSTTPINPKIVLSKVDILEPKQITKSILCPNQDYSPSEASIKAPKFDVECERPIENKERPLNLNNGVLNNADHQESSPKKISKNEKAIDANQDEKNKSEEETQVINLSKANDTTQVIPYVNLSSDDSSQIKLSNDKLSKSGEEDKRTNKDSQSFDSKELGCVDVASANHAHNNANEETFSKSPLATEQPILSETNNLAQNTESNSQPFNKLDIREEFVSTDKATNSEDKQNSNLKGTCKSSENNASHSDAIEKTQLSEKIHDDEFEFNKFEKKCSKDISLPLQEDELSAPDSEAKPHSSSNDEVECDKVSENPLLIKNDKNEDDSVLPNSHENATSTCDKRITPLVEPKPVDDLAGKSSSPHNSIESENKTESNNIDKVGNEICSSELDNNSAKDNHNNNTNKDPNVEDMDKASSPAQEQNSKDISKALIDDKDSLPNIQDNDLIQDSQKIEFSNPSPETQKEPEEKLPQVDTGQEDIPKLEKIELLETAVPQKQDSDDEEDTPLAALLQKKTRKTPSHSRSNRRRPARGKSKQASGTLEAVPHLEPAALSQTNQITKPDVEIHKKDENMALENHDEPPRRSTRASTRQVSIASQSISKVRAKANPKNNVQDKKKSSRPKKTPPKRNNKGNSKINNKEPNQANLEVQAKNKKPAKSRKSRPKQRPLPKPSKNVSKANIKNSETDTPNTAVQSEEALAKKKKNYQRNPVPREFMAILNSNKDDSLIDESTLDTETGDAGIKRSRRIKAQQQKRMSALAEQLQREQEFLESIANENPKKKYASSSTASSRKGKSKKGASSLGDDDETDINDFENSNDVPTKGIKKRRRRRKGHRKRTYKPWSGSESEEECHEDSEYYDMEEEDEDDLPLIFNENDDEFACEEIDENAEPVVVRRARTAMKIKQEGDEIIEEVDDGKPCNFCFKFDRPEIILLCDKCDSGFHTSCLNPPLHVIPEGDWYCLPCEHKMLCERLTREFKNYDQLLKLKEREELRKQRLAYVGISLDNVLKPERKPPIKKMRKSDISESSASEESAESEESNLIYTKRSSRVRKTVNYQFKEYDDLIATALQDEMGPHPFEPKKEMPILHQQDGGELEDDDEPRQGMTVSISRKKRKPNLNDLDVTPEEEEDSDYQGNSSPSVKSEATFENLEDTDHSEYVVGSRKSTRSSHRARRRRYHDDNWSSTEDEGQVERHTRRSAARRQVNYCEVSTDDDEKTYSRGFPKVTKKRPRRKTSDSEESDRHHRVSKKAKKKRRIVKTFSSSESEESSHDNKQLSYEREDDGLSSDEANVSKNADENISSDEYKDGPTKKKRKVGSSEEGVEDEEEEDAEEEEEESKSSDEKEESDDDDSDSKKIISEIKYKRKVIVSSEEEEEDADDQEEEADGEERDSSKETDAPEPKPLPERKLPKMKFTNVSSSAPAVMLCSPEQPKEQALTPATSLTNIISSPNDVSHPQPPPNSSQMGPVTPPPPPPLQALAICQMPPLHPSVHKDKQLLEKDGPPMNIHSLPPPPPLKVGAIPNRTFPSSAAAEDPSYMIEDFSSTRPTPLKPIMVESYPRSPISHPPSKTDSYSESSQLMSLDAFPSTTSAPTRPFPPAPKETSEYTPNFMGNQGYRPQGNFSSFPNISPSFPRGPPPANFAPSSITTSSYRPFAGLPSHTGNFFGHNPDFYPPPSEGQSFPTTQNHPYAGYFNPAVGPNGGFMIDSLLRQQQQQQQRSAMTTAKAAQKTSSQDFRPAE